MSEDHDLCTISLERFSPDLESPLCPVVGECGHSLSREGIQFWFSGRQTDEYHKRKKCIPCVFKCTKKWVSRKGKKMEEQIKAFRPENLVPNVVLCEALKAIQKRKAGEPLGLVEFDRCPSCKMEFSTAPPSGGLQHDPKAPIAGVCGDTICASCIYDQHQTAMQNSYCDNLKYIKCPLCSTKGAFHADHLAENRSLISSLRYWKELPIDDRNDYKPSYEKKSQEQHALSLQLLHSQPPEHFNELCEQKLKDLITLEGKASQYSALTPTQENSEGALRKHERNDDVPSQPKQLKRPKPLNPPRQHERALELTRETLQMPSAYYAILPAAVPRANVGGTGTGSGASNCGTKKVQVEDALLYLDNVRRTFHSRPEVYNDFLSIMKNFNRQIVDTPGVIDQVIRLFHGNNNLILGFNKFVPDGHEISVEDLNTSPGAAKTQAVGHRVARNFDDALSYTTTIKTRFANNPKTFHSFLKILGAYQKQQHGIKQVMEEVIALFSDHPDLIKEFAFFLPATVHEQAKERLYHAAAESETRLGAEQANKEWGRAARKDTLIKQGATEQGDNNINQGKTSGSEIECSAAVTRRARLTTEAAVAEESDSSSEEEVVFVEVRTPEVVFLGVKPAKTTRTAVEARWGYDAIPYP
ncbi:amphipathic helix protein Sin3-like [Seminavis robusta]|uniref:Amphipathic helix protein Sin3-like n=1 Tax=Seminavis robusta TaxID=568900 RepID=A0A9N8EU15_9STRA|nr:amphipathic helix protein Sin3-like [Seminavis robusta]|eukprot:Sro1963_g308150.1 amphipathic helix protein Sin3-like (642) ;mRNA; r:8180-10105